MAYINVGASVDGMRVKSKAALKRAIKDSPATVAFDSTSPMGESFNGGPSQIPAGVKLSVVGPDPYTDRRWYATVEITATGVVKVS